MNSGSRHRELDVLNSFRMNADDPDSEYITIKKIRDILHELEMDEVEIISMTEHLMAAAEDGKRLNFEEFIKKEFGFSK